MGLKLQQRTQKKQILHRLLPAAIQTMTVTVTSQLKPAQEPARSCTQGVKALESCCLIRSLSWGFQKWNTND